MQQSRPFAMLALILFFLSPVWHASAARADTGTAFVAENANRAAVILQDPGLTQRQKEVALQSFLLGITDLHRTALFTLGDYQTRASPQDVELFCTAFRDYAVRVYRSYFAKFSGQRLVIKGTTAHAPGDEVIESEVTDPSGRTLAKVAFRVMSDHGTPTLVDMGFSGMWLAREQRTQFGALLARNGGDVRDLSAHLTAIAANY